MRGLGVLGLAVAIATCNDSGTSPEDLTIAFAPFPSTLTSLGATIELSISFTTKDGTEELALFGAVEGLAAVTAGGRAAVLLVAEDQVSEIHDKLQELRAAEPLPEDGAEEPDEQESEEGEPG